MSKQEHPRFLVEFWNPIVERFGFVLRDGSAVELKNESPTPSTHFQVDADKASVYEDRAVATWHTHPRNNVNLSADDYWFFLSKPELLHYIVTETRMRCFSVRNGKVMLHDADCV